jgi:hypothetical protein
VELVKFGGSQTVHALRLRVERTPPSVNRPAVTKIAAHRGVFSHYAATTLIRPALRDRGFRRITISTSRSSAVNRFISRSTEKPASL